MGGMVGAIEQGYVQGEIQQAAYKFAREVEEGRRIVVGVNKYAVEEEQSEELLKVDARVQKEQIARVAAVRSQRDAVAVVARLSALRTAAASDANLMPPILDAVKAYATIGEICNTLREVFGEYKEHIVV
jgi:methylmalonyl-CoA mutase N-terminal domain/subunit